MNVDEIMKQQRDKEEAEYKAIIEEQKQKHKGEWDVKIGDPIEYFDSNLSYEITGYKPITATKGLDFNPEWFTEASRTFKRTGHYCQYAPNTKSYADFWTQEYVRCRDGMKSHGYTITGDNYYFLNYYQLMDLTSASKAGAGRSYEFPKFFVKQYEYFHYIELCKQLRKNAIGLKARGVGQRLTINSVNSVKAIVINHLNLISLIILLIPRMFK